MYLTQAIHRAVAVTPDKTATICGTRVRTWQEFRTRVARLAGSLRLLGVERGDRIAILSMNSDRYFEACFAAWWADAVIVPMNTRWSVAEHIYSIEDAGASLLVLVNALRLLGPSDGPARDRPRTGRTEK